MKNLFLFMFAVSSSLLTYGHTNTTFIRSVGAAGNFSSVRVSAAARDGVIIPGNGRNYILTKAHLGEPVATDDISENNVRGSGSINVPILDNDLLSNGSPATTQTTTVDIDLSQPGEQPFLSVPGEGTWLVFNGLTFFPDGALTADPTPITYTLTDVLTGLSDQATVTISFLKKLLATSDVVNASFPGSPAVIAILANDKLINGAAPAPTDVSVDIDPGTPGLQSVLAAPGEGTWTYDAFFGFLTFTPDPGFTENPTPINYTLTDNAAHVSDPATVTINYPGGAELVANNDISINNIQGASVAIQILNNDMSGGNPIVPFTAQVDIDAVTPGVQSTLLVAGEGLWNYDFLFSTLTFSPSTGFVLDPTPITYTLTVITSSQSDQATVTVRYKHVLTATSDFSNNNTAGLPAIISILNNDLLSTGSTPTPSDVSVDLDPATPGIQTILVVSGEGTWNYDPATGLLTFSPGPGLTRSPTSIIYSLTDSGNNVSGPAIVTVTYVNKPTATDDISNTNVPGSPVPVFILNNDLSSDGGTVFGFFYTFDIDAATPGNQLTLIVPGEGTWTFDGILALSFIPEATFTGDPTPIIYKMTDNNTGLSDEAKVTVQYLTPPVAQSRHLTITTPPVNSVLPLDGQAGRPARLSGTDRQDGSMGAGNRFTITNLDGLNGNALLYNNVDITSAPFTIESYDPSLLAVKFTGVGSMALSFNYLVTDSQGLPSNDVAYELTWENPLPVTLVSFIAKAEGSQVALSWATSEESNSDHFEIQRSGDGLTWQSMGQSQAAGLSSIVQRYFFTDEHPVEGQNLYRLKMVDTDHSYTYSQIRSARVTGGEKIIMSPNPVSETLTIDLPSWKNASKLTILDQSGRERGSAQPEAKAKIDVRKFQTGIYLLVIHYQNGAVYSQQILIK